MRKLKKIESINNKKPWLANTVLLLLLPLSRQSQPGKDRQTERGTEDRSISLAFVRPSCASLSFPHHPSIVVPSFPDVVSSPTLLNATHFSSNVNDASSQKETSLSAPGLRRWRTRLPRSTSARSGCTNSSRSPTPTAEEGATAAEGRGPPRFTWDAAGTTEGEAEEEVRSPWVTLRHHGRCADWKMSRSRNHRKPAGPSS